MAADAGFGVVPLSALEAAGAGPLPAGFFGGGGGGAASSRKPRPPPRADPPPLNQTAAAFVAAVLLDPIEPSPPLNATTPAARRAAVRAAAAHSWAGYVRWAWGQDELAPVSRVGYETFCGIGITLLDSLDTLYLMGFDAEFGRAREWVAGSLNFSATAGCPVSVFEATIRALGGLLAAHDLSGDAIFLEKAADLGDRLAPAFGTPRGVARSEIDLVAGVPDDAASDSGARTALLAELGSLQARRGGRWGGWGWVGWGGWMGGWVVITGGVMGGAKAVTTLHHTKPSPLLRHLPAAPRLHPIPSQPVSLSSAGVWAPGPPDRPPAPGGRGRRRRGCSLGSQPGAPLPNLRRPGHG